MKACILGNLFGSITKPACVASSKFIGILFIVEFQPAGYYAFSGMPQKELTDLIIPFEEVNPELYRLITQQPETASAINGFVSSVDRLFMVHIKAAYFGQEFSLVQQNDSK